MKVVGLFRELTRKTDTSAPSIHDAVGLLPLHKIEAVVTYLKSGVPVFDVMEATSDPLDRSISIPGGPSLLSDGFWIWRNDLPYFVEKYQVALPEEFLSHALKHGTVIIDQKETAAKWQQIVSDYELARAGKQT